MRISDWSSDVCSSDLEPLGAVSRKMRALKVGETLLATMPAGRFTLPLHHARPLVLIAFGIGITPFMSMLETLAANRGDRSEERRGGKECVSTCRSRWSPSHYKKTR